MMDNPQFNIYLTATQAMEPGHAILRLPKKWQGTSNQIYACIYQNEKFLQPAVNNETCEWGTSRQEIALPDFSQEGEVRQTIISSNIVDALLALDNHTYSIVLRDANDDIRLEGRLNIKNNSGILKSSAKNPLTPVAAPPPVAPPQPQEPPQESDKEPITATADPIAEIPAAPAAPTPATPAPPSKNSSKKLVIILLVLLLILAAIGLGAKWWLSQDHDNDEAISPKTQSAADVSACNISNITDEGAFIKDCLATNPSAKELLALIQEAKEKKQCSLAQRLYSYESQYTKNLAIAVVYVQEYDPKYHKTSTCFKEPDVDIAIYWYKHILEIDPKNKEAKKRLEELTS